MKTCIPLHMGDLGLSVHGGCSGWRQGRREQSCLITQCGAFWSPLKSPKDLLKGHQEKCVRRQPNGGQAWDCSYFSTVVPQLLCTPHARLLNVTLFEQQKKKLPVLDNGKKSFAVGQKLVVWNRGGGAVAFACFLSRISERWNWTELHDFRFHLMWDVCLVWVSRIS